MESNSILDEILDSTIESSSPALPDIREEKDIPGKAYAKVKFYEPGYTGTIDPRIRQLSYSSLLTLHRCPREFQLYKLRISHRAEEEIKKTVTFAFGHVVGEGIQLVLQGLPESQIIWKMFLNWHTNLFAQDEKAKKSFWAAVFAVQKFRAICKEGALDEYELVYYQDKPACELSFSVLFPNGFRLRGYVDAVLRHKNTGKIIVLEIKTTAFTTLNAATYKNSAQGIGYSVVLDVLFPDLSDYDVFYLVYQTKSFEFTPFFFTKTYSQRALWIRELLHDIEQIERYNSSGIYPMHGENCLRYGRECEYFQSCTLGTEYLTKECTEEDLDREEYQVQVTLEDLLEAQFKKLVIF